VNGHEPPSDLRVGSALGKIAGVRLKTRVWQPEVQGNVFYYVAAGELAVDGGLAPRGSIG
jgi:hypothetical protein